MIRSPRLLQLEDCEPLPQLPLFWRLGYLPANGLPLLWPVDYRRGLLVQVGPKALPVADRLVENVLLQLLLQSPPRYLRLSLCETGLQSRFPWLESLYQQTGGHALRRTGDRQQVLEMVTHALERARNRQVILARERLPDWQHCLAAGRTAEPVEFLVVAGLWADPELLRVLRELAVSGGPLGVVTVILHTGLMTRHLDAAQQEEVDTLLEEIRRHAMTVAVDREGGVDVRDETLAPVADLFRFFSPRVDEPSEKSLHKAVTRIVSQLQTAVEPPPARDFLEIPVGRSHGRAWPFTLGAASRSRHALIGGVAHAGKTSFLQMLVTRICEQLGPAQVRLHLLDYKDGFSFGLFPGLPHLDAVHQDHRDPGGLRNSLQAFLAEMERRRWLFQSQGRGVGRIELYNDVAPVPLPRWLLVVDEIQGALRAAGEGLPWLQTALRELAGQGGTFGLHLVLTSQTSSDSLLDEATRAQFGLKIAFRPGNSAESEAFFGRVNEAALSLPPYHALFNAMDGDPEGNVRVELDHLPEMPDLAQALDALRDRYPLPSPMPEVP